MLEKGYNEFRQRGRFDFPIEFHHVDSSHPRFYMPYHWHIEYEVNYIRQGEVVFYLNESIVTARAGDIVFIRDGIVHGGHPRTRDAVYDCIVFDMKKLVSASPAFAIHVESILSHTLVVNKYIPADTPNVGAQVRTLFSAMQEQKTGYELVVTGALYTFLGLVLSQNLVHAPNPVALESRRRRINELKRTLQLIDAEYARPLTLKELSDAAGLSPNYFCRYFKKITHHSPTDYLNRYRIEIACIKMKETEETITSIALACGFNDVSYFIRLFRKYKGVSPARFRKSRSKRAGQETADESHALLRKDASENRS